MTIDRIINILMKSNKIFVTFHQSPDGDSLGSSLALINGLRSINKNIFIVSKEAIPENFSFLSLSNEIDGNLKEIPSNADCLVTLDCGNVERLNCDVKLDNRNFIVINIDHHLSNDYYGDINYVDTKAASVGEIIYRILTEMKIDIDTKIAECIYTSILTDTGSFRHSNTTYNTHLIAGELINTGLDFSSVHRKIFDNKKIEIIKLQGLVIDSLYTNDSKDICIMKLTEDMLSKVGVKECDSADLISIGLKIVSVEIAILLKETEDGVKVSLRSKNYVDVRKVAEKFGGGGHIRAAGLKLDAPIEEVEKILLKELEKELI
ncbi:bifunctional oligoribonuclease and PAP phosphatase NrnA [Clostridium pasteurianum DSM 525 = ATCC 6013]|uniref:3'(2'),5'-bisphosphate nucleotidase n=1 Tax=Clostridium pasteurianum DSM 525 = ATCC 6013 TaxID=1262449 RepID=A0A0H3J9Z2_CLOPA|nr:bifunctional oligoribonuclease/PAP phosphatase NrnA [Clostridium pasteurianum]AJA48105.1 bifunctional oligoribonuclease and PAP phosphatase NrnA [Clostridium pasteurianum DSM 525 = ATCC 6013]AJA52093.1 bifunctional oligoribonuclease and PAP phosphatase NrnA [Clostridium pasteurianum DSM 525 = ATCC 6013]AOZ75372.1 1-pyrroline-5-carboxylate dehydrogenase [Clostridium pasteurianum DSM 525 = ATCC 6013]AOZ79167.1 1-pyrroline-5-carboxylate dehydrogenase [Clostridium pasteurianum]ELP60742.1 Exopol